jgi:hypothetical protein
LTKALLAFKDEILGNETETFFAVTQKLDKLSAWALRFPEYNSLYKDVVRHYSELLHGIVNKLQTFLSLNLEELGEEDIVALPEVFKTLTSLAHHQQALMEHGLKVDNAVDLKEKVKKHVCAHILDWKEDLDRGMCSDVLSLKELLELGGRAKQLMMLRSLFEKNAAWGELEAAAVSLVQEIQHRVVQYYQESCQKWASSRIALTPEALDQVKILREGAACFSALCDTGWEQTNFACDNIVASIRSCLSRRASSLDELSDRVATQGISDGIALGRDVVDFDQLTCFDELFDCKYLSILHISAPPRQRRMGGGGGGGV